MHRPACETLRLDVTRGSGLGVAFDPFAVAPDDSSGTEPRGFSTDKRQRRRAKPPSECVWVQAHGDASVTEKPRAYNFIPELRPRRGALSAVRRPSGPGLTVGGEHLRLPTKKQKCVLITQALQRRWAGQHLPFPRHLPSKAVLSSLPRSRILVPVWAVSSRCSLMSACASNSAHLKYLPQFHAILTRSLLSRWGPTEMLLSLSDNAAELRKRLWAQQNGGPTLLGPCQRLAAPLDFRTSAQRWDVKRIWSFLTRRASSSEPLHVAAGCRSNLPSWKLGNKTSRVQDPLVYSLLIKRSTDAMRSSVRATGLTSGWGPHISRRSRDPSCPGSRCVSSPPLFSPGRRLPEGRVGNSGPLRRLAHLLALKAAHFPHSPTRRPEKRQGRGGVGLLGHVYSLKCEGEKPRTLLCASCLWMCVSGSV